MSTFSSCKALLFPTELILFVRVERFQQAKLTIQLAPDGSTKANEMRAKVLELEERDERI